MKQDIKVDQCLLTGNTKRSNWMICRRNNKPVRTDMSLYLYNLENVATKKLVSNLFVFPCIESSG